VRAAGPYLAAAAIGAVAGMRSMAAPAFVSYALHEDDLEGSHLRFMTSPPLVWWSGIAAAGEMIADKLPFIPDRVSAGPLVGRMLSGAVCGAAVSRVLGREAKVGAAIGLACALGSAFAAYHLRRSAGRHAPDQALGVAEDSLVVLTGSIVARSIQQHR